MSYIEWKPIYETGIEIIDVQHRNLIEIINKLHVANITGTSQLSVSEILQELLDYTIFHFQEEEKLLSSKNYPKLDDQKRKHEIFTRKVRRFVIEDKIGQLLLSIKIIDFLKDWTINHILGDDMEYVGYFKKQ